MTRKHKRIISSILDTDFYKLTQQQVVYHNFAGAIAVYSFINRGENNFPPNFSEELRIQINALSTIRLTLEELNWLKTLQCFKEDYLDYLKRFRFNPNEIEIQQDDKKLILSIKGKWENAILWEVPLMAIISELYFKLTDKTYDEKLFSIKTENKAIRMSECGVKWSDFGTRRRFSKDTQDSLNCIMSKYVDKGFLGTSNPYFAMKYGLIPIGTYAHEAVMAMQVKYNAEDSNNKWMEHWLQEYGNNKGLLTALTDTLTTDVFLRHFDRELASKFAAVRQDSGPPIIFGVKMIEHYKRLGIDPKTKRIVFSDSLDTDKACALQERFSKEIDCVMGIGTHLSNDCGHKPLNMVIKLVAIDFGEGLEDVVKLSDDEGKYTGNTDRIKSVKEELGISTNN